jgi:ABC-type polar amino acid transport system ATPase subunit
MMRRLGSAHHLTMLMVMHQMGFAREFADQVCFFQKGRLSNNARRKLCSARLRTSALRLFCAP